MPVAWDFWRHPKKTLLRRAAFHVHLWAGLIFGLYLSVMSATGVLLLFSDELEQVLQPEIYRAASSANSRASVSTLIRSAAAAYPDRTLTALYAPTHARPTAVAYLKNGDEVLYAYLHPVTARVVTYNTPSTSAIRWLRELHFNLFAGRTGRAVNGIGGLALFLIAVTGVIVWWPGIRSWPGILRLRFTRNWKRLNWELHSTAGVWSAAALSMWAITGFYFGHAALVNGLIHRISPLAQVEAPVSTPVDRPASVSLQSLVEDATRRSPKTHFFGLQMPASSRAPYVVFMSRVPDGEKRHSDYHYFDQYTGAYLGVWHRGVPVSAGDAVVASVVPLHFGDFGGPGVKALWAVFGIVPLGLFATGLAIWWNRRRRPVRAFHSELEPSVASRPR